MRYSPLSGHSLGVPTTAARLGSVKTTFKPTTPNWVIRYAFYAFVFSLPFETANIGIASTVPKLCGLVLAVLSLFRRSVCYALPPKAFWWFVVYTFGYVLYGLYVIVTLPELSDLAAAILSPLRTMIQLLILFWISYNLLRYETIVKGVLWAFAGGSLGLACLQILGLTGGVGSESRATAFDQNPNVLAAVLSLGLLALVGLAYGLQKYDWKGRVLFWLVSGILAVAIVQTGSRGALVGLVGSLSVFFLRGKSVVSKIKFGMIALGGIIFLAVASYQIDTVRKRWEQTIYEGSLAGREEIFPAAVGMVLEKPLLGWGPVYHTWELGARLGILARDEHNLYLWLLAEGGIVGAFPFLVGLWLCTGAAWRARHSSQGVMPVIMLSFVLITSLKGTPILLKFFWIILSYGLASGSYVTLPRRVAAVPYRAGRALARPGIGLRPTKKLSRPVRTVFGVPRQN